ncbi:MAG: hypothetical protein ACLGI2_17200 [Acidimicrobiia bacterium]
MADQTCPACGNELPDALAQHADNLEVGLVTCPSCGAGVTIAKGGDDAVATDFERAEAAPPGRTEGQETFAANETFGELKDELENKPR